MKAARKVPLLVRSTASADTLFSLLNYGPGLLGAVDYNCAGTAAPGYIYLLHKWIDATVVPYALDLVDLNNDKKVDILVGHVEAPSSEFFNVGMRVVELDKIFGF